MHPLETYLRDILEARHPGVAETTHYPALRALLNEIGGKLKPKVRCILHPKGLGAGLPDGGLFTPDQLRKTNGDDVPLDTPPSRGAIEAKPVADDAFELAKAAQVKKYLDRYRQVLATNFRDFVLVDLDRDGKRRILESYRLASDEDAFWAAAAHPRAAAENQGERFADFLRRAMLHPADLADPKDVAWFLASYAREARWRVEHHQLPALAALREALEQALGLKFEGEKGDHFFRSTLVQTLFYGVFAAWVLWSKEHPPSEKKAEFDWRLAGYHLRVPIVSALFEEIAKPSRLKELGVDEVLDWAGNVLNRVDRAGFFTAFEEQHAVQYFYEPFLEAYDPALRKELGVWYTPPEVVSYMVERVDSVLRSELEISDGLADSRVFVLDPCCGTGSFVVEVLRRIEKTLREKGSDALTANQVKRAAIDRVFGFEIMPAPYVVSHLQLGIALAQMGAPLTNGAKERPGVFLTNALTGWEPPQGPKQHIIAFPQLEAERDAAEEVKRTKPILVILGNPPYNGFAGVAVEEERSLTTAYRETKRAAKPQGQGLNDLYVRFFRMAERRIAEMTGKGIVCFISNYSWLDGLSFTGMRERYLEAFDTIRIDCLNGDKYKTGKLTPEGKPDPSIFSTDFNREGIQVGTAIALLARRAKSNGAESIAFRDLWGKSKLTQLREEAENHSRAFRPGNANLPIGDGAGGGRQSGDWRSQGYQELRPVLELGLPFRPTAVSTGYLSWPLLPELFPTSFPGVKTSRDEVVVDISRMFLTKRMKQYFDPRLSDDDVRSVIPAAITDASRFNAKETRRYLVQRGFKANNIVRYSYRPFDNRWLYWEPETKLLDEKRSEYFPNIFEGNIWLAAAQQNRKSFDPPVLSTNLCSLHVIERGANMFPAFLRLGTHNTDQPNLSKHSSKYLADQALADKDVPVLFNHAVAILYSSAYSAANATALRQNWPRIPLPNSKNALVRSAVLGHEIAALLDTEAAVQGVTGGAVRPELKIIAVISREGGKNLDPGKGHLAVTAGWGHAGVEGAVMPGKGRVVERDYSADERAAVEAGAKKLGLSANDAYRLLGERTNDIFLNEIAYWKNIPARVWEYTIGGYQVIKKWLSYRERDLLGRDLKPEEIEEVTAMAWRIAAIILMEPALDANYEAVKKSTYKWPQDKI